MIKLNKDLITEEKQMFNGNGTARLTHILEAGEEMYNKGRVFSHVKLAPGAEIGYHVHHGDGETYYILKGTGEYSDNGNTVILNAGDVAFVDDGEGHGMKNIGDDTLEAIALILYK